MKIASVDFPESLLKALRDRRLVVFAGAGVSMGPPANLPSFYLLAEQVTIGTGQSMSNAETEDCFLGRLQDRGLAVHQRAAGILQQDDPQPTTLHKNLLRLFGELRDARVVTTNFDDLFEQAARDQFKDQTQAQVFQAPTLPLGNRFRGIVHLHGSVAEPDDMVLTHRDFGRAYLTESDGWARRFLIDLFSNCTVLFVGYSHRDTIMTYLTPSLPPDGDHQRFALVGDQSDDLDHWKRMGIEPIAFQQEDQKDFSGLNTAVARLAQFIQRGALDWQSEITAIAGGGPPIDDESADIIEHALTDPALTRFFVAAAELPKWIEWLDCRGHLRALFTNGGITQQDKSLASWLVSRFAMTHDGKLFALIGRHGGQLNPFLWRQINLQMRQSPDAAVITRWALCLASAIPAQADPVELSRLAQACASIQATDGLLRVYEAITARLAQAPPLLDRSGSDTFHDEMQKILSECVKPNLPEMAEPLLSLIAMRLKSRHAVATAWKESNGNWYQDNHRRWAIEPHERNDGNTKIDSLVDMARECLEWLARHQADVARLWSDRYARSSAPLLRRLAVHTLSARTDLSDDEKLSWLLERCYIHEGEAHHEIRRAVSMAYPGAGRERRSEFIKAMLTCRQLDRDAPEGDRYAAYRCFEWLHWLNQAAPNCELAAQELNCLLEEYPEFLHSERSDATQYPWGAVRSGERSPWTVAAFLGRPAVEALPDLLAYQPTDWQMFNGDDRQAMLRIAEQAVQADPSWGLDLADAMVAMGEWETDLWNCVIPAWTKTELHQDNARRALSHLSIGELRPQHAGSIADVLRELVRNADPSEASELLDRANSIAVALRPHAAADAGEAPYYDSWLNNAINHPFGKLALFWIFSIGQWRKRQDPAPQSLSDAYRDALDAIVQNDSGAGKLGRAALASNFNFLLTVDEAWTIDNLLPLFDPEHADFQYAWDGFLTLGHPSSQIAELLRQPILDAVPRVCREFQEPMRRRFVAFYVAALGWLINGANDDWIVRFFNHADAEMKTQFALAVRSRLRMLNEAEQRAWWDAWLRDYWENRLQGVPSPLDDAEIAWMLEWVIQLPSVFPEAVSVATRMPAERLDQSHILQGLGESELIERYPDDLAKFLIHLGEYETAPWFWVRTQEIVDRLLAKGVPAKLDHGLRELSVRLISG